MNNRILYSGKEYYSHEFYTEKLWEYAYRRFGKNVIKSSVYTYFEFINQFTMCWEEDS